MIYNKFLFPSVLLSYVGLSVGLFLYSYTQVDLNLTLSRVSLWQSIQKSFQYIGYYQRPFSTAIYVAIVVSYFFLYLIVVYGTREKLFSIHQIWKLIIAVSFILVLSYPAFSYDIFNYMFTAKTVIVYHANPYSVVPLQFKGIEPWLSFMRWTHLPSAYSPIWITLTIPLFLLGFGYFLLTLWSMKLFIAIMYIASIVGIGKVLHRVDPGQETTGIAIFALNPLIIIETLVSAHNDITMMLIAIFSLYLYVSKKYRLSFLALSTSIAVKLITIFLLPIYFFGWNRLIALILIVVGLILVLLTRDVLPWYFVWIIPFVALLPRSRSIFFIASAACFGLLLRYTPYLYRGNWDGPSLLLENLFTIIPIVLAIVLVYKNKIFDLFYFKSSI